MIYALAGMIYAQGKYTPEEWIAKTGIDPRQYPQIEIRNGKCYWTAAAEKKFRHHASLTAQNWQSLGILPSKG